MVPVWVSISPSSLRSLEDTVSEINRLSGGYRLPASCSFSSVFLKSVLKNSPTNLSSVWYHAPPCRHYLLSKAISPSIPWYPSFWMMLRAFSIHPLLVGVTSPNHLHILPHSLSWTKVGCLVPERRYGCLGSGWSSHARRRHKIGTQPTSRSIACAK